MNFLFAGQLGNPSFQVLTFASGSDFKLVRVGDATLGNTHEISRYRLRGSLLDRAGFDLHQMGRRFETGQFVEQAQGVSVGIASEESSFYGIAEAAPGSEGVVYRRGLISAVDHAISAAGISRLG